MVFELGADGRRLAADVLGQLGFAGQSYPFRVATIPLLARLLSDADLGVVRSALIAFGHLGSQDSLELIAPLAESFDSPLAYARVLAAEHDTLAGLRGCPVTSPGREGNTGSRLRSREPPKATLTDPRQLHTKFTSSQCPCWQIMLGPSDGSPPQSPP